MRNARPRRNISAVIAIVAIATFVLTIATHEKGTGPGSWFGVFLVSLFSSIGALVAVVTFQLHVRWEQQLLRGDKFLARWTVLPAEWAQFRESEKVRRDAGHQNAVKVRKEKEAVGIDVVVAQDSLMVDNDFFKLVEIVGLRYLPETPPCLEYNMVTRGKNGSVKWNIRFPVATGAEAGARAVWDHVNGVRLHREARRDIKRFRVWRQVGLILGIACIPVLVYGYANRVHYQTQNAVLWCLIGGFMGVVFGFFVSLMSHVMLRRARGDA